ncbi:MAG: hypothetical protein WCC06_12910 [Candidatus Aminicenantales bacterium]
MKSLHRHLKITAVILLFFVCLLSSSTALAQALSEDFLKSFTYREIGPTRQGGRFVDFAVPLQPPYTFYAATASGSLWKTVNNGQTFEPIFDHENVFSIGDIAVAPSDPNILWVGTGEANNSRSCYWGDGVYKSVDAGKTWKNMGLKESHHIGRIVIHPANPDIVYVAALGHLYSENPERGLYKTEDGGKTWVKILDVVIRNKNIGVVDVVMDPRNPNVLYAAAYDKVRKPWTFNCGGPGSGIYKTTDSGKTWKKLGGGLPGGMLGRIGLAVYAKNPNILYAGIENVNKPGLSDEEREKELREGKSSAGMIDGEVYRSDDAGETWRKVSPDKQSIGGAPGYYYGQIIIDPQDDQIVYVLSVSVLGTRDGGKNWNRRVFNFGGDNHALWIDPDNSNHMLLGYDHGMGITFDGGRNWYHPDFVPLAQFYAVGVDMSFPYRVAGGTQDNGSLLGPSTKKGGVPINLEDWQMVGGGDGMYNVFDQRTNRYLYNESQFGPLQRIDLVTGEVKNIAYQNIRKDLRWNWCAPILISPHDSDTIYHGANILMKSTNRGESWKEISPDLSTNDKTKLTTGKGGDGNIQFCTITTIDESPLVEGLLWAGTDDGNVWVTKDGGKNWTKLNDRITENPGYWVSRVTASSHDPGTAYVAYAGYRNDDFRPFLYRTTDYGETWTSIAGNLPEGPVNVIRQDHGNPNLLFTGTEFGVFVSIDGGQNWTKMKNNMPTQPVHDLVIHPRENDLVVATHGRGLFITDITPLQELTPQVLAREVYLFRIEPKIRWEETKRMASSSSNFNGESEPAGLVINYFLKNKPKGEVKAAVYKGTLLINELKGTADSGIHSVLWDMTKCRERTPEEKKQYAEMQRRFAAFGGFRGRRMDPNYIFSPAPCGEYRIVLTVDGREFFGFASILQDFRQEK